MTHSMTAFARQGLDTPWGPLVWELRSVNHRYLDVSPRLPEELRILDPQVRERVGQYLTRGKVECHLKFQPQAAVSGRMNLDEATVRSVLQAIGQIESLGSRLAPADSLDILRWPGVLKTPVIDVEALGQSALDLLSRALEELNSMRAREGERLRAAIEQRLNAVQQTVLEVSAIIPEVTRLYRTRLEERMQEIKAQLDSARLEQEIALMAQRSDVAEELDRLRAHVVEVQQTLELSSANGRRLDFLMQELNREANTLASKAADIRLTKAAVDLKVWIEQMREQVQNIE